MKYLLLFTLTLFISVSVSAAELSLEKRLECGINMAIKYDIPADILLAISTIENGDYDIAYRNDDGSIDYGVMQINTVYIKELKNKYNKIVSPNDLLEPTCYSFEIAAFKISNHLQNNKGSFLERVANYHSYTEDLNRYYQSLLITHSYNWRKIFQSRQYITYIWSFNK